MSQDACVEIPCATGDSIFMKLVYTLGKLVEMIGMVLVAAALLSGMGVFDGNPSMSREMLLLGVGGVVFTLGWFVERSAGKGG